MSFTWPSLIHNTPVVACKSRLLCLYTYSLLQCPLVRVKSENTRKLSLSRVIALWVISSHINKLQLSRLICRDSWWRHASSSQYCIPDMLLKNTLCKPTLARFNFIYVTDSMRWPHWCAILQCVTSAPTPTSTVGRWLLCHSMPVAQYQVCLLYTSDAADE